MNLTLALPEPLREVSIDGEPFVLVRKSALDALSPAAGGERAGSARAVRTSRAKVARARRNPANARTAMTAPEPEPAVSETLRSVVLKEIQQHPGRTSLEIGKVILKRIPTTSYGSIYQAVKALMRNNLVEGKKTDLGATGWHPVRSS